MTTSNQVPAWHNTGQYRPLRATNERRLPPVKPSGDTSRPANRLLWLPERRLVVLPYRRDTAGGGWCCVVVALGTMPAAPPHVTIPDAEVATARDVPIGFPVGDGDSDTYAAIWQACAHLRFPGGPPRHLADVLAARPVRRAGTLCAELDPAAVRRVLAAVQVRKPVLEQLIGQLETAGLLTPCEPALGVPWSAYMLTMPGHPMTVESAPDPGTP